MSSEATNTVSSQETDSLAAARLITRGFIEAFGAGLVTDVTLSPSGGTERSPVLPTRDASAEPAEPDHGDLSPDILGIYTLAKAGGLSATSDDIKVAVAGASRALEKMPAVGRSWIDLMNVLMTCPLLAPCPEADITRARGLTVQTADWLESDAHDGSIANELRSWLGELLKPATFSLDVGTALSTVSRARGIVSSFALHKGERRYRKLLDLTMVLYPYGPLDSAFLRVHRVELYAWRKLSINDAQPQFETGFEGHFNDRVFCPRDSVIAQMKDGSRKKAVDIAEALFPSAKGVV